MRHITISVPYICPDPKYLSGTKRNWSLHDLVLEGTCPMVILVTTHPQLNSIVYRVLRERSEHRTDQRGNQCDMALYNGDLLRLREWILVFCSL